MQKNPRCYTHRNRDVADSACETCNRIAMERDIVTRTVDALLAAGYELTVEGSGDEYETDRDKVFANLMECDDEVLLVRNDQEKLWVQFVYGNDGHDVIADYTIGLESVLKPINEYADKLAS